jgi:hypothetical protein
MSARPRAPSLYYEDVPPAASPSPLRSDIAGFAGRTRRGPVGVAVRVTGLRECTSIFGALTEDADTPCALQGYFDNGGDVAHIVRLFGAAPPEKPDWGLAVATWDLTRPDPQSPAWAEWDPQQAGFGTPSFQIRAASPGAWANGLRVTPRYRRRGPGGGPEVDLVVRANGEPTEYLLALDPTQLVTQVAQQSRLIRLLASAPAAAAINALTGPRLLRWSDVVLGSGLEIPVSPQDYTTAIDVLADVGEVAMLALPDLMNDAPAGATDIQQYALTQADALHDRLVLLDLPPTILDATIAVGWSSQLRDSDLGIALRSAAAYHPWLSLSDPLGGTASPVREVAPCGHVAGLISLLDRQRGAHYTPANATLADVLDVTTGYTLAERGALNDAGINLLRCNPNQGIQVWGGRTLHTDPQWRYVAHRRLIHRLVRAIRRVAEPLVFESNGPPLWLAFTRAVTTVLAEAYRAGGLQGERPEDAFRVTCDTTNNPPGQIDLGQVICDIQVAPAVPMEFITLRVAVSDQGTLDVFES